MSKTIGQIVGDLIGILTLKDVLTLEEVKTIIGEDKFNQLIEEANNNDNK
jgi:hypothetical protein